MKKENTLSKRAELKEIKDILLISLSEKGVKEWLNSRLRTLDGETPNAVLKKGEYERVKQAALSFINGNYP
jgi:hypothetical protein